MKILHVIQNGDHSGCSDQLLQLTSLLNKQAFESIVVNLGGSYLNQKLEEQGVYSTVIDRTSNSTWKIIRRLKSLADYYQVDIIHCHDRVAANFSLYAARRLNIPFIYNVHCWSFNASCSLPLKFLGRINERFLTQQASINVLSSNTVHNEGRGAFDLPNAVVIPYGVDSEKYNPDRPGSHSRRVYGIPDNYTVVGFLSRPETREKALTFIRAAAKALKAERKLHFMIVGENELKGLCKDETNKLGIENHFSFQDIKTDIPQVIRLFDIYCLPYRRDGLSAGLLEAMAMRKAIITSPVEGNLEIIADRTDGMLVYADSPEAWKNAIIELHREPEFRRNIGRQARMLVERYYDIHQSVATYSKLYSNLDTNNAGSQSRNTSEEVLYRVQ